MKLEENVALDQYTTLRAGGDARFFVVVHTVAELREALLYAHENALPVFVLGGGSNVLVSDSGWSGLVIKMEIGGIDISDDGEKKAVIAGAGVVWDELVAETVGRGLYGLENLSHIPGTVGAAPVQNIGAYGVEAGERILWVEYMGADGEVHRLSNDDCAFAYRNSIFKRDPETVRVIIRVAFWLETRGELDTAYADVEAYFSGREKDSIALAELRQAIIEIRTNKLPDWTRLGTAGSFFENPVVSKEKFEHMQTVYPEVRGYAVPGGYKLSAAWLIDHVAGMKGVCEGSVCAYEKHALVLVNTGEATGEEILAFADTIIQTVHEKTGVTLVPEVRMIGV